ncbi:MAG: M20/M25/M40 family metallo-hydrolase [Chloracidobacterium sp.]|nr:M20/M25/M40 family metallo-hydrolase [Chloracidobacterium sp.]
MFISKQITKKALAVFFCLAVFTVMGSSAFTERADHWISVDASELSAVAASVKVADGRQPLSDRAARVLNGVAILRLDDQEMEDLSRSMHDIFHKCGGFVLHSSEADALAWVERMTTADQLAPSVVYSIDNQAAVNILHSSARELDNRQVITDLSAFPNRRYNQPSGLESANWIKNKWTQLAAVRGNNLTTVEFYTHDPSVSPQPSVVLTIRGATLPDEVVVVGAHQDSINGSGSTQPAPGADDDASGIACMTEMIRVMMSKSFRPARTVKFIAYAAEEVGLRGSNAIATAFRTANTNVVGVLQLDMTNYKGSQGVDFAIITDYTNAAQNQFLRDLIATYQPTLNVVNSSCGYACSDHASWHNKSYPASFPFEAPLGNDNPWIHTSTDTISRSNNNADHALKFTKLGLSYVAELAKGCISPRVQCSSIIPERPSKPELKLTSATRGMSGSVFLDAMSF